MIIKRGIPVSPGVVIKRAFVIDSEAVRIPRRHLVDSTPEREIDRFLDARQRTRADIKSTQEKIEGDVSDSSVAGIFAFHLAILEDEQLVRDVTKLVRERSYAAEYALSRALRPQLKRMRALEDEYLRERANDFRDVERRLLKHLMGQKK